MNYAQVMPNGNIGQAPGSGKAETNTTRPQPPMLEQSLSVAVSATNRLQNALERIANRLGMVPQFEYGMGPLDGEPLADVGNALSIRGHDLATVAEYIAARIG